MILETLEQIEHHQFSGGNLVRGETVARSGSRDPEHMNYKSQQPIARTRRPEYEETTSTGRHSAEAGTTSPRMHRSRLAQGPPGYVVFGGLMPIHSSSRKMQIPPTAHRGDFSPAIEKPGRTLSKNSSKVQTGCRRGRVRMLGCHRRGATAQARGLGL